MRSPIQLAFPVALLGFAAPGCGRVDAYSACNRDMLCGSDAPLCQSYQVGSNPAVLFCTRRCNTPAATSTECPSGGACVRLNGGSPVCMKRCAAVSECDFANAVCQASSDSLGATVCTARP